MSDVLHAIGANGPRLDLLKNKSQPEKAASEAAEWVQSERELKERLKREREEKELKEKLEVRLFCLSRSRTHRMYDRVRSGSKRFSTRRARRRSSSRKSSSWRNSSSNFKRPPTLARLP